MTQTLVLAERKQITGRAGCSKHSASAPNRVERYTQYDQMDMDSEINAALDTIAEFGTQEDTDTELPFRIKYNTDATEAEVQAPQHCFTTVVKPQ